MEKTKRPTPLAVRLAPGEKEFLETAAKQYGTTRNNFVRMAAMSLAAEIIDASSPGDRLLPS